MRYFISLLVLFATVHQSFSQNATVKGKITSEKFPLELAYVGIPELSIGTSTNQDGEYTFTSVPAGKYIIEVRNIGFETEKISFTVKNGEVITLNFDLKESNTQLEAVEVIDTQSGLNTRTPYAVSRVDARKLENKGNPSGIMGLVMEDPAVYGAELGQGIVKPFIRGLGFSRIVTIFQSNKLENHQWGADHGLGLNDLGVGNVEIIKGPASILYGSGALGGVLLVKDDEPYLYTKDVTGSYGFTYNSISGGYRPRFSVGKSNENGFFIATDIAYENHADYKDGNGRIIGNSRYNSKNFRVHTGYHSESFSNKFSYTLLEQRLGIIEDSEMDDEESLATTRFDRKMQLPFQAVTDHVLSYRQNTTHGKWETALNLSYHINTRKEIEDAFDEVDLGLQQTHLFYNARVSHQTTKSLQNTFGVQGSWINNSNLADVQEILIPDARVFDVGMYYMANLDLGDYFLQGGLRYDYRDVKAMASSPLFVDYGFELPGSPESRELLQTFKGFTGSLGASRKWNKFHTLKANLSTGFRAPDLAELFSNGPHPGTNRFEMGNANFGREQSFQADLSWIYTGTKLRASVSVFGNMVENYIYFTGTDTQTDDGLEIWEFRQTDARLYGTEVQLGYHPYKDDRLFFTATANFVRGEDLDNNTNLTFIPADNFMGRVDFKPISGRSLTTFVALRYVDTHNRPGLNEMNTPMYTLLSAGVNHEFKFDNNTLAVGITGFNLLNRTYFDHMSILRAFEVNHAGRNIMANVQYRF